MGEEERVTKVKYHIFHWNYGHVSEQTQGQHCSVGGGPGLRINTGTQLACMLLAVLKDDKLPAGME